MGAEHINPRQLSMFLDPVTHISQVHSPEQFTDETRADLWARKRSPDIRASLQRGEGIQRPVRVLLRPYGLEQFEGHHRIAEAAAHQLATGRQTYVPVEYETDDEQAFTNEYGEAPDFGDWDD